MNFEPRYTVAMDVLLGMTSIKPHEALLEEGALTESLDMDLDWDGREDSKFRWNLHM